MLEHYYLRARYYDPSTGRFTSRDPFEGVMREPLSLAKYPYGHGNPVNLTDPSGLFVGYGSTAITISNILLTAYVIGSVSYLSRDLERDDAFPDYLIQAVPELANIARTPISLADSLSRQIAAYEAETCSLWNLSKDCDLQGFPYIVWGMDLPRTTEHTAGAIRGLGSTKNPPGKAPAFLARTKPGWKRGNPPWYNQESQCNNAARTAFESVNGRAVCDEYPYASVWQGGQLNYEYNSVAIRLVPAHEQIPIKGTGNLNQANMLLRFYGKSRGAGIIPNDPIKMWFGVGANLLSDSQSFWVGRDGVPRFFR